MIPTAPVHGTGVDFLDPLTAFIFQSDAVTPNRLLAGGLGAQSTRLSRTDRG